MSSSSPADHDEKLAQDIAAASARLDTFLRTTMGRLACRTGACDCLTCPYLDQGCDVPAELVALLWEQSARLVRYDLDGLHVRDIL